jgi:hypothetical protein
VVFASGKLIHVTKDETIMRLLRVGDWVRTSSGEEGQIDMLSRQSAFIEFESRPNIGKHNYLQNELTKINPPTREINLSAITPL